MAELAPWLALAGGIAAGATGATWGLRRAAGEHRAARDQAVADSAAHERLADERFRLIARATSDAIWDWDIPGGQLWWSDSFDAIFGNGEAGRPPTLDEWEGRIHPADRDAAARSLGEAVASAAGGDEWMAEYRFLRADGGWSYVLDRALIQRGPDGVAVRVVGGMLDVTRERQGETDLRLLRRAIEAAENGVLITDALTPDHPIVFVNGAFERITGYPAEEALGRNCRFLQGPDRDQSAREQIRHALSEGRESRSLLRNYRRDGSAFWNELLLAPVRDDAGMVTHFVGILNDVSERISTQEALAHRATHDELTTLPNRQLFLDRLGQAIREAQRFARDLVVLFIDLDNFKLINDSLGHAAGDTLLRTVSNRLQACLRTSDTVARFGGDEFVILLVGEAATDVGRVLDRVAETLLRPVELSGAPHYVTASVGYARFPTDGEDAESLLQHADLAMYRAKERGRNCAVAYEASFDQGVSDRLFLISRLREAEQKQEFVLHFQPQFSWDGRPVGLEALIRWQHPERGLLAPGHFVDALEESGLIVAVGRWVLREAARHYRRLAEEGFPQMRIAVNVSASQLQHGLLEEVEEVMREFGLPPGSLELELTESVLMVNAEAVIEAMRRVARQGVSIAVDDFGTGYSSLAYLKRLPIQRLKIDRSFVRGLGQDPDDESICASVISMASALGLDTVAEGVETPEQRDWLAERGCGELQGYLLGRPVPFHEALATLHAAGWGSPLD